MALICVAALCVSMVSFLTRVRISPEDGIGAGVLAENDPYVNASATERLSQAARSFLMLGDEFQQSYQLASYHIGRGNYEEALESINQCISLCDDTTDVSILDDLWLKYGCIQAVLGVYEEALKGFQNMSEGSEYDAEKEIVSAQIALEKGDMATAYGHLTAYNSLAPEDATVYGLIGDCCYYVGKPEEAGDWYTKAEDAGVALEASEYMLWCMSLMDVGVAGAALMKAEKALELGYEDTSLCYSQCAICCYMMNRYELCLEYGAKALESDSSSVDYGMLVYYMGLATFALEQYAPALEYFNTAEAMGCQELEMWFYRGFSKMLLEDPAGAVEDFTRSETGALHDNSCLYRGICLLQTGDVEAATADLEAAARSADESIASAAQELLLQLSQIPEETTAE